MLKSLGWSVVDLFRVSESNELTLITGFLKILLKQTTMPDPSKILLQPPPTAECGNFTLHFRIGHGDMTTVLSQFTVDPDAHAGM